jgi:NAD(P)-dependent dehydrogenase (short-subunit alcohol dehydrogenase family)
MPPTLTGAVAVVTGAGRGIGAATAVELAARGARVVLVSRTVTELAAVAAEIAKVGGDTLAVRADVTDESDVERIFTTTHERFGPVTHLVNNAGTALPAPLEKMSLVTWRATLDTNLTSTYLCSREALKDMLPRGRGRIVNVSSVSGVSNVPKFPGFVAYAAAKAGVIAFTEALAAEVGPAGVRVLCVSPGAVATRLLAAVAPQFKASMVPADVARIIAFLASDDASAANGSNLIVGGD